MTKAEKQYADIINHPEQSHQNIPMSILNRAAQFSPFAALTGFDAAVEETARLTEEKTALNGYAMQR